MQPRDLKKYQDFLKEPQQYGEPHLRSGAKTWLQRNEDTKLAFQKALAAGLAVPEAEQAVLQEAKTWHWDISQGDIAAIPLQSQVLVVRLYFQVSSVLAHHPIGNSILDVYMCICS